MATDLAARGRGCCPTLLYPPASTRRSRPARRRTRCSRRADPETHGPRFAEVMARRSGPAAPAGRARCPASRRRAARRTCPRHGVGGVERARDFQSWWKGTPERGGVPAAAAGGRRRASAGAEPERREVLGALTTTAGAESPSSSTSSAPRPLRHHRPQPVRDERGRHRALGARGPGPGARVRRRPVLRLTEYGWATGGRSALTVTTEDCQAALIYEATRRLAQLRTELNIRSIIQFQWHDVPVPPTNLSWPHYAGLVRADGSPKPSLGAVAEAIADRPPPPG